MHETEFNKQSKINTYLTNTLKHLNMTIDILIEQYDPIKIKQQKLRLRQQNEDNDVEFQMNKQAIKL